MSIPILKLTGLTLTEETHPEYGTSYSFPVSGIAGYKSTGINVEVDGKLMTLRFFNKKTEQVDHNGKNVYVPAAVLKEVKASIPKLLKTEAVALLEKAQAEIAELKASLAAASTFNSAKVVKTKS